MSAEPQNVIHIDGESRPPEELSDDQIQMIHSGLLIPSEKAVHSMAREIRKWRGVPNPDLV